MRVGKNGSRVTASHDNGKLPVNLSTTGYPNEQIVQIWRTLIGIAPCRIRR